MVGGEALVDLVPVEQRPLAPLAPRLGGGPYNVAVGLGRLGTPATMLTRLSTDSFGDALLARLRDSGVDDALVQRGDEPSTLAVVTVDETGAARYSFHVAGAADRLVADPGALPADTAALAVGTLSLVLEPGASVYADLARRAAETGVFVSLDPNIREALVTDPDAVRARLDAIAAGAGLVKLSDEDARWWGRSPGGPARGGRGRGRRDPGRRGARRAHPRRGGRGSRGHVATGRGHHRGRGLGALGAARAPALPRPARPRPRGRPRRRRVAGRPWASRPGWRDGRARAPGPSRRPVRSSTGSRRD